jgi:PAS domain S-box-containing protein
MENETRIPPVERQIASHRLINQLIRQHSEVFNNPVRLLIIIVGSLFLAETLIMLILSALPPLPAPAVAFLDAGLLIILLSPLLYFVVMKPARSYMANRRQIEETVRVSEEKYRSLVESTDDSVYLLDRNCRYLYMNKKHMVRMGFSNDEYVGRAYSEFHPAQGTTEFTEAIGKVFETCEPAQHEHMSQRDEKYFLRTLSPVKGNDGKTELAWENWTVT